MPWIQFLIVVCEHEAYEIVKNLEVKIFHAFLWFLLFLIKKKKSCKNFNRIKIHLTAVNNNRLFKGLKIKQRIVFEMKFLCVCVCASLSMHTVLTYIFLWEHACNHKKKNFNVKRNGKNVIKFKFLFHPSPIVPVSEWERKIYFWLAQG